MAEKRPAIPSPLRPTPVPLWPRRFVGFPAALPPLVGRERDVTALSAILRQPGRRLITLTGPGGVGKTRLAIAVAMTVEPEFAHGAVFVPLAPVSDPLLVLPTIARSLEVRETPGLPLAEALAISLRDRSLLLVLDNFEHLLPTAAELAQLLLACPRLIVLVTSRAPLHLSDEQRFAATPLALPRAGDTVEPAELTQFGATAFFIERAQAVSEEFALDARNARAVVDICRRLDGLPLAIELAAAWVRVLPPAALLERLEPRLALLKGGPTDQPDRLRTMRDAIGWSYGLLTDEEQRLFRRLGVFVGGFSLEGVERIWDATTALDEPALPPVPEPPSPEARLEVLDLLAGLIDKSLLQLQPPDGSEPRFTMLETVREFAWERLVEHGEAAALREAHAAYILALAERAAVAAGETGSSGWMRRLAAERPNIRAALDWLEELGRTDATLRMTGALWHYWYRLGDLTEGRSRLERALAAAPADAAPALRARALRGAGVLAWQRGDYDQSRRRLEASLAAYELLGDRSGTAWVLNSLGCLLATMSVAAEAEIHLTEALVIFRELDNAVGIAQLTANLGELAEAEGRHELAIERLDTALTMWRALGDRASAARSQIFLANALLARNETARAEAELEGALAAIHDVGYEQILPAALRAAADLSAHRRAWGSAARWYGAEERVRESLGMELPAARRSRFEHAVAVVREALGQSAFDAAWAAGRNLAPDQAVAEILTSAARAPSRAAPTASAPTASGNARLSRREREVLALVVDGCSDRDIAQTLFISRRTVSSHVAAILGKLGTRSRAEAAVRAVRDGLV